VIEKSSDPYVAALEEALLDYIRRYGATDLARHAFRDPAKWAEEGNADRVHNDRSLAAHAADSGCRS
jgi:hypothetical protein